jgi:hypothetical protein
MKYLLTNPLLVDIELVEHGDERKVVMNDDVQVEKLGVNARKKLARRANKG